MLTLAPGASAEMLESGQPVHYPTSSSRLLLDLLRLSRCAESGESIETAAEQFDGIVSRPVLRSLLGALRLRDAATVQHARRAALLATGLARYLGWDGESVRKLEIAALLHDIGKIGVPDHILLKPGALNPAEQELVAVQHHVGMDVLQACRVHQEVLEIISQANSNYDIGLRTTAELHQGARILAIADAYDSMSTPQVYRDAKQHDEIISVLMGSVGTRFDSNLVSVLGRWISSDGLPFKRDVPEPAASAAGFFQLAEEMQASSLCHIFSCLYYLESYYDGFYLVDADLRFRIWNHGMERLLGRTSAQPIGQIWSRREIELADQQHRPLSDLQQPLRNVIKTGKGSTTQLELKHEAGHWVPVEVVSVPLIDHDGSLQGVAEIFREIQSESRRRREDKELQHQATRDSLTGAMNRGELERTLDALLGDFHRDPHAAPFSLLFLDVDHFKQVNDTYLHLTGDEVLTSLAKLLRSETYSGEIIGRYGGEEFVLLCPGTDLPQAVAKAERLRHAISEAQLSQVPELKVTVSFGVTEVERGDNSESLIRRADRAMFTSKEKGRDRTTALNRTEFLAGKHESAAVVKEPKASYVYESSFLACVQSSMIVLKFSSYVKEEHARLVNLSEDRAVLRLGRAWLPPFWGRRTQHQPVEVRITFGPPPQSSNLSARKGASERTLFNVQVVPRGWPPDIETFQARARLVLRTLKAYFVAD